MATEAELSATHRLGDWPAAAQRAIRFLLLDIDDTLTTDGRLTAAAYAALERLSQRGLRVIPVTGRPAGWCDLIARFWPVDAVVGENGAFWFRYDLERRTMIRRFWLSEEERTAARERLDRLGHEILTAVPGARLAADQPYRVADLAIDYCEDAGPHRRADARRRCHREDQLDPCQWLVRRLGQAGDDPTALRRALRYGSGPARRGRRLYRRLAK